MSTSDLLQDIEDFLVETGMSPSRFGLGAARNSRLVERLRAGRRNGLPARVWPETEQQIRAFIRSEREKTRPGATTKPEVAA